MEPRSGTRRKLAPRCLINPFDRNNGAPLSFVLYSQRLTAVALPVFRTPANLVGKLDRRP